MTTIIGLSGSLRKASYNSGLLRAAATRMPAGATLDVHGIADIPLYDGDLEKRDFPASVARLKDAIAAADGLLIVTPEYNNSIPGVFKNAIDWCSRPSADGARVWAGKKVAIAGATLSGFGTILSQTAWLPVFRTLTAEVWAGDRLLVSSAIKSFDEASGDLTDDQVGEKLAKFLSGFVGWVAASPKS